MATQDAPAGVPLTSVQPDDSPRLSREGLGALKFNWRKANVKDDWTKGGSLSHAWDRVTGWPYWKKPSYDLDYGMRVLAKIAQEVPAWREVVGGCGRALTSRCLSTRRCSTGWKRSAMTRTSGTTLTCSTEPDPAGFAGVYNPRATSATVEHSPRRDRGVPHAGYPAHAARGAPLLSAAFAGGRAPVRPRPDLRQRSSNMSTRISPPTHAGLCDDGERQVPRAQHLVYDDEIEYDYSVTDIVRIMCEQHLGDVDENGSPLLPGIDCEVGKMFPVCVTVGGLAAHARSTRSSVPGTGRVMTGGWGGPRTTCGGNTEPDGGFAWCAPYYDRDIPYCMSEPCQQLGPFFIGPAMQ